MKTAILTDSNSGIFQKEAEELGIFTMAMPVIIDGAIRFEGINIDEREFFALMTNGRSISTSMPSPGEVTDMWDRILSQGYDELVYIPMSSGLSNSCHAAKTLADDYEGKVWVADNHRISVTMRTSVMEARELALMGKSAEQITAYLEDTGYENSSIYITCDTLKYLLKGGRVTPTAAAFASILNIKPVLTIQGEKLDAFSKVRGIKKARQVMVDSIVADRKKRFKDVPDERIRIGAAGSGLSELQAEEWRQQLQREFPNIEVYYNPLSLSVDTHIGPGGYGCGISVFGEL